MWCIKGEVKWALPHPPQNLLNNKSLLLPPPVPTHWRQFSPDQPSYFKYRFFTGIKIKPEIIRFKPILITMS